MADKVRHNRVKVLQPLRGDYVPDQFPTVTIKKSTVLNTVDAGNLIGSANLSGTSNFLMTGLHLQAGDASNPTISLVDRDGTVDVFHLGTYGNFNRQVLLRGDAKAPLYTMIGTVSIYNAAGSFGSGTFVASFEGIQL